MNIQQISQTIKPLFSPDIAILAIIILVGLSSFGLGRLSVLEKEEVVVTYEETASVISSTDFSSKDGGYVASLNGSVYHLPWCSGAERIKEENKIWFNSKEEAERAGYRPAQNCKGL